MLMGAAATDSKQVDQWVSEGFAYDNTATLSFETQMQKMSDLGLMISMDSANGHIAANYGLPVITLWGQPLLIVVFRSLGSLKKTRCSLIRLNILIYPPQFSAKAHSRAMNRP